MDYSFSQRLLASHVSIDSIIEIFTMFVMSRFYYIQGYLPLEGSIIHSLQRSSKAVASVLVVVDAESFFAGVALAGWMVFVASHASDFPAIYSHLDPAIGGAQNTCSFVPLLCRAHVGIRVESCIIFGHGLTPCAFSILGGICEVGLVAQ